MKKLTPEEMKVAKAELLEDTRKFILSNLSKMTAKEQDEAVARVRKL